MDILMPVKDGIRATREIVAAQPDVKVLILTTSTVASDISKAKLLSFASKGLSNPEIARLLGISVIAVKKHFEVIYAKIGASNRSEAITIALRNNLLKI